MRVLRGIRAVVGVLIVDLREVLDPRLRRERFAGGIVTSRRDGRPLRTWTDEELRRAR